MVGIIIAIISVIIAAVTGWLAHLVSHSFDFAQAFKHIRTRSPTLNMLCHIKPIEIIVVNITVPPYEIKGKGIPTTGINPDTIEMFIMT